MMIGSDARRRVGAGEGDDFAAVRAGQAGIEAEQNIRAIIEQVDDDGGGFAERFQAAQQAAQGGEQCHDAGVEQDAFAHVHHLGTAGFVQTKRDAGADAGGGEVGAAAGLQGDFDQRGDGRVFVAGADEGVAKQGWFVDGKAVIDGAAAAGSVVNAVGHLWGGCFSEEEKTWMPACAGMT
jgi:hypothetical protein